MPDMPTPPDAGQRALAVEIMRRLADGPAPDGTLYEPYGQIESTFWGAGVWVKVTEPNGTVKFQHVTVVRQ